MEIVDLTAGSSAFEVIIQDHTTDNGKGTGTIQLAGKRKREGIDEPQAKGNEERIKDGLPPVAVAKEDGAHPNRKQQASSARATDLRNATEEFMVQVNRSKCLMADLVQQNLKNKQKGAEWVEKMRSCDVREYIAYYRNSKAWLAHQSGMHASIVRGALLRAGLSEDDLCNTKEERDKVMEKLIAYTKNIGNLISKLPMQ
jgi:hypothetical protein